MRVTRVVVCPDKLRGSLTAAVAADAIAEGVRATGIDEVTVCPVADGGEGTLAAMLHALGGSRRRVRVTGPLGDPVDASFAVLSDGTAVVEMAQASGLDLVEGPNDPLRASSRGSGELIRAALEVADRVVVGVGGSASTDGGLAAVEALGWTLRRRRVTVACDVTTEFLDAAARFAPQKGASPAQVELLTRRLSGIAALYEERMGIDVRRLPGAGAAGGLAGGLAAIGAELEPGFDVVAEAVGLDELLATADAVFTGEGRVDAASFTGKVVGSVLDLAEELGVACRVVIAGEVTDEARAQLDARGAVTLSLAERAFTPAEAFERANVLMREAAVEAARELIA